MKDGRTLWACDQEPAPAVRLWTRLRPLVGVELVHVPYLAERPPHFLDDLHVFERRVQRLGGGVYCIHHGLRSV
jgi:hypothetical protein